jgi:hypothetical protein
VAGTPSQWTGRYTDTRTQNSVVVETINLKTTGTMLGHDLAGNVLALTGNTGITLNVGKSPIVLDLNHDGVIQYLNQNAGVMYDYSQDGQAVSTSWVGPQDGFLALQKPDTTLNIVFSTQASETDLQGLAKVYDTNHDNILSVLDHQFQNFGIWQDASTNGKVDTGEFVTLTQAGITSISLASDNIVTTEAAGDVIINGHSTFTKLDGSLGKLDDASFSTGLTVTTSTTSTLRTDSVEVQPEHLPSPLATATTITLTDVLQDPVAVGAADIYANGLTDVKNVSSLALGSTDATHDDIKTTATTVTLDDLVQSPPITESASTMTGTATETKIDATFISSVSNLVVLEEPIHV